MPSIAERRRSMGLLARATRSELSLAVEALGSPVAMDVRRPETGLVMLRGRIGGDGAPFNVGEATVTRAAVRLASGGAVGSSYVLGRDADRARMAAVLDALWQQGHDEVVERSVLSAVAARLEAETSEKAARTAATRVDFFTLVRGED